MGRKKGRAGKREERKKDGGKGEKEKEGRKKKGKKEGRQSGKDVGEKGGTPRFHGTVHCWSS